MRIGFAGAGNMAQALARGIHAARPQDTFAVYDPDDSRLALFESLGQVTTHPDNAGVAAGSDVVFLAVKPQVAAAACAAMMETERLVVSIVAGTPLATLESWMPRARVVRVMPNTPALVLEMAAGYTPGSRVTDADLGLVEVLLTAAGLAIKVEERQLDAVTGLSGSGPAFMARVFQAFSAAGEAAGLPPDTARRLTLQTALGTARLLLEREMSPEQLVQMVSSPNGTTVAGRAILEESAFGRIIHDTVAAAVARSRELGL